MFLIMKQSNQYVIVNVKDIQGEVLNGIDGQDALNGGLENKGLFSEMTGFY